MYEAHFQFSDRPFSAAPLAQRYFAAQAIEQARQTILRTIERAEGPAMLIGPAGTGKTLLFQVLAGQLRKKFRVVQLSSASLCSRRALLQSILFELNLPYRDQEEGELRLSLMDYLQPGPACPHGIVLLVDEAHTLTSRMLDEIRLVTNLMRDGQPRVRLVLAGSPALEELFTDPKLESFNQRLAARCYLHPLTRDETHSYVAAQIAAVGGQLRRIMSDDALTAIYRATDGIPRLINQVCDHALMLAFLGSRRQLNAAGIEEAWADLQQLPLPWHEDNAPSTEQGGVIEFGELTSQDDYATASDDQDAACNTDRQATIGTRQPDELAESQLEDIQLKVAQIESDTADTKVTQPSHSSMTGRPEVDLVFHGAHDPFSEPFEEEEVIIDHYATLDASSLGHRPMVSSEESVEIAQALAGTSHCEPSHRQQEPARSADARTQSGREEPVFAAYAQQHEASEQREREREHENWQTVIVPSWQAEEAAIGGETSEEQPAGDAGDDADAYVLEDAASGEEPMAPSYSLSPAPELPRLDDGDLLIVEDDSTGPDETSVSSARARRQDYRQLFARLRRG